MKTIIVDDEIVAIKVFMYEAENIKELEIEGMFQSATEALRYADKHTVDLAILDIQMTEMDGILLGHELRKKNPDIMLIYITGYEKYAMDALKLHAAAYLTKPYSEEELRYAVETARLLSRRKKKRIYARTFGYFDVFVDEKPIMFKSAKAKELLALLIDRRGGIVTTEQIINVLWEDRLNDESTQNLCSKIVKTLQAELRSYGAEEMLVVSRGSRRVDTETFDCDLYEMLEGNQSVKEQYIGEYLLDYSWSENRTALLDRYIQ
ncbi:MAG: response regulator [Lachnospiraceae bacterium]|nr:response regulator [Lachnospiraceae bacterium]MBP3458543.1 response regulator [Lachnospiraceae bacterium]